MKIETNIKSKDINIVSTKINKYFTKIFLFLQIYILVYK